jgi:hypothetical protein
VEAQNKTQMTEISMLQVLWGNKGLGFLVVLIPDQSAIFHIVLHTEVYNHRRPKLVNALKHTHTQNKLFLVTSKMCFKSSHNTAICKILVKHGRALSICNERVHSCLMWIPGSCKTGKLQSKTGRHPSDSQSQQCQWQHKGR